MLISCKALRSLTVTVWLYSSDGSIYKINFIHRKFDRNRYKTRSSAVAVIADRTACKFAVRAPLHVHCSRQSRHTPRSRRSHRTALFRLTALERNAVTVYQYWDLCCASFFVVHFVAKRYILEQKCQKGRIGTLMLGSRWNNF